METQIKRLPNGAIDTDHYVRKSHEIRAKSVLSGLSKLKRLASRDIPAKPKPARPAHIQKLRFT